MDNETKTMDTIISDAQKEGIDFNESSSSESQSKPDVTKESSSETKINTDEASKAPVVEKTAETEFAESKLPAHLFPRFKELYSEKQRMSEKLKANEALLKDPRIARLLAQGKEVEAAPKVEPKVDNQTNGQITDEQKAALAQLKSMLGLDQYEQVIESLKRQNEELSKREEDKAFDAEETELKKLSADNGLDYETEVYPQLSEWLSQNKQYQGLGPGSLKFAFNNVFFSKMGELAERKKNIEMMEKQKKLKSGNVETPAKSEKGKTPQTFRNDEEMIASLIKEAGGHENIDFNS